jgi:hypothetical protein
LAAAGGYTGEDEAGKEAAEMSETAPATPPDAPAMSKSRGASKLWVPVVLALGLAIGSLLAQVIPTPQYDFGPDSFFLLSIHYALVLHVLLSTLEVVLLASLVIVYANVYAETRANFSLGILVVMGALLLHSVFSYPLLVNEVGPVLMGSGLLFPYTDILTIVAYSVFLYLSLE